MSSKSNYVTTSSHCIAKEKINPDIVLEQQWYVIFILLLCFSKASLCLVAYEYLQIING